MRVLTPLLLILAALIAPSALGAGPLAPVDGRTIVVDPGLVARTARLGNIVIERA